MNLVLFSYDISENQRFKQKIALIFALSLFLSTQKLLASKAKKKPRPMVGACNMKIECTTLL
jgi:hypothetical protein